METKEKVYCGVHSNSDAKQYKNKYFECDYEDWLS